VILMIKKQKSNDWMHGPNGKHEKRGVSGLRLVQTYSKGLIMLLLLNIYSYANIHHTRSTIKST